MKMASGVIVLAQETRFRLVDDDGRSHIFVLSHGAGVEPQDLPRLQREQSRISVAYREAPHLVARLAHAIYIRDGLSGDRA